MVLVTELRELTSPINGEGGEQRLNYVKYEREKEGEANFLLPSSSRLTLVM